MRKDCINRIIDTLYTEVMLNLEQENNEYKKYTQEEMAFKKYVESLGISAADKMDLNNKLYFLSSRLSYLLFIEGLRASKTVTNLLSDENLNKVIV